MQTAAKEDEIKVKFASFLASNPRSSISYDEKTSKFFVTKPWGDDTFDLAIPDDDDGFAGALNAVVLPERYSAIYHPTSKSLEVAYTVFRPSGGSDVKARRFDFHHNGKEFACRFDASSSELLKIASHVRQKESFGSTSYRNLMSYNTYMLIKGRKILGPAEILDAFKDASPISFWIESVDWDEDQVLDLIYHLNFYMSYFDSSSPMVLVHTPADESITFNRQERYPFGPFPSAIVSNGIDRNLLQFWRAAQEGDPARRFLYNYQILEYASYYMIEEEVSKAIARLLMAPNALSEASVIAAQIHEAFGASKMQESQKSEMLLRKFVRPEIAWAAIQKNKEFFSVPTEFEGGYKTGVLLNSLKLTCAEFEKNWSTSVATALRNLRNALSHGKEARMSSVITPTAHNMRLLQPWVMLIAAATKEIMVYRTMR